MRECVLLTWVNVVLHRLVFCRLTVCKTAISIFNNIITCRLNEQCMWIGKGYSEMKHKEQNRWELNCRDRTVDGVLTVWNSECHRKSSWWLAKLHTHIKIPAKIEKCYWVDKIMTQQKLSSTNLKAGNHPENQLHGKEILKWMLFICV